ncbi:hypothetical protein SAMN05444008_11396 [Cnuella takakiae]|uniref:AsmA-like C-terminal region n=1 Tax=Cnuella takakiae TaxID=1302690 RepID=A0A1M5F9J6_9BACT|nr:hypothetical protein [Cnuella takakiae]OLY91022.1 hypothetical protein BUE76_03235 [Cnuella takakiae]SHF88078.1 hypothetical protein SAMN05444008_11396 [Cnuella takakiae]
MQVKGTKRRWVRIMAGAVAGAILLAAIAVYFANQFVTPLLRSRLHTLIIQGSDSLYRYKLGKLDANFFGGNVAVENLQIRVDSNRYRQLRAAQALPPLTMQLDLQRGYIKGLSVFRFLLGKQIRVSEIGSLEANVRLSRHVRPQEAPRNNLPLWKAIQPSIKSIHIDRINLDGVKLLYRNADTSESVKLQFDRCEARFEDIRIDSAAAADTARLGFARYVTLNFHDLKFRTPDSSYKMKAESIIYSSKNRYLELSEFKLQPTLEQEDFYKGINQGLSRYEVEFKKAWFTNLRLDQFINNNIILADSGVMLQPELKIYADRTQQGAYHSKYGAYPHQKLLTAAVAIDVKGLRFTDAAVLYTERGAKSGQEGTIDLTGMQVHAGNITNLPAVIRQNSVCTATMQARIFETCPIQARFQFFLDSAEGEFAVVGKAQNISAAQLNKVAVPLGNAELKTGTIQSIDFNIRGDNYNGRGIVNMRYQNLTVALRKVDEETGAITTQKFLSKLLNRFTLHADNPGPNGVVRPGREVVYARPSTKSFFATIWKTIFKGMQDVMLKSGVYE